MGKTRQKQKKQKQKQQKQEKKQQKQTRKQKQTQKQRGGYVPNIPKEAVVVNPLKTDIGTVNL